MQYHIMYQLLSLHLDEIYTYKYGSYYSSLCIQISVISILFIGDLQNAMKVVFPVIH